MVGVVNARTLLACRLYSGLGLEAVGQSLQFAKPSRRRGSYPFLGPVLGIEAADELHVPAVGYANPPAFTDRQGNDFKIGTGSVRVHG